MTNEYPRKGDRVKVTYEGVVTRADDMLLRFFQVDGVSVPVENAKVEVIHRTYPAGTVAISRIDPQAPAISRGDGTWFGATSESWVWLTDGDVQRNPHFTVVHEPKA